MSIENTSIAKDNTIRTSQLKLANIVRLIVNQKVNKAVEQLKFSNKRVSQNVLKVLNSAIANAENNNNLDIDTLEVKSIMVNQGMRLKRMRPRARGRADRIIKPTCHIEIILSDQEK